MFFKKLDNRLKKLENHNIVKNKTIIIFDDQKSNIDKLNQKDKNIKYTIINIVKDKINE